MVNLRGKKGLVETLVFVPGVYWSSLENKSGTSEASELSLLENKRGSAASFLENKRRQSFGNQ